MNIEMKAVPSECSCHSCQNMCRTMPCFPTPGEAQKLIEAGYQQEVMISVWFDIRNRNGVSWPVVAPIKAEKGCIFFKAGKCELHERGLKPMEGRLAGHGNPYLQGHFLRRRICQTWATEKGIEVLTAMGGDEFIISLAKHEKHVKETSIKTLHYGQLSEG